MTPEQRDLILAALGLRPRNGRMPRWSYQNGYPVQTGTASCWPYMVDCGWAERANWISGSLEWRLYEVTRAGAEAAGVLGRCRTEDVGR